MLLPNTPSMSLQADSPTISASFALFTPAQSKDLLEAKLEVERQRLDLETERQANEMLRAQKE
jgi:hypothetical protein